METADIDWRQNMGSFVHAGEGKEIVDGNVPSLVQLPYLTRFFLIYHREKENDLDEYGG